MNDAPQRVVLDTNLLVGAAYNRASASRQIIEACLVGQLSAVVSSALRREYALIVKRAVRDRPYAEQLRQFVDQAQVIEPAENPRVVPDDPEDDKLVALALAADATIITNDAHLHAVAGHDGLRVLRPARLVQLLQTD